MRREVPSFLVRLLPLDARGRRAVDEVVADWDHEAAVAQGVARRLAVDLRGASALAGAVMLIAVRELKDVPASRALWTTIFWMAIPFTGILLAGWIPWALIGTVWSDLPWRLAFIAVTWSLFVLPPALFAGAHRAGRGGQQVPYLGLALVTFVTQVIAWWLVPVGSRPEVSGHAATLVLPEASSMAAERVLLDQLRLSLLCTGPMLVLLAGHLRSFDAWQTRLGPLAVAVAYFALLTLPVTSGAAGPSIEAAAHDAVMAPWLLPAVALAGVAAASRRGMSRTNHYVSGSVQGGSRR